MKVPPVELPINILRLISSYDPATGIGVNEICKLTGYPRYKQPICMLIRDLEKATLIKTKKNKHSQRRPKILTEFGKEIVDWMVDIEKSNHAYFAIKKVLLERKTRIEEARAYGLNKEETEFLRASASVLSIEDFYQKSIYNLLIYRFKNLLAKFNPNQSAKEIVTRILIDEIENQLLNAQEARKFPIVDWDENGTGSCRLKGRILFEISDDVFEEIDNTCMNLYNIRDKAVWIKTRNLISCLLRLFKPNDLSYIRTLFESNPKLGTKHIDTFDIRSFKNRNHLPLQVFREYLEERHELTADGRNLLNSKLTEEDRKYIRKKTEGHEGSTARLVYKV